MIFLRDSARRLPEWDAPVKFALALALSLLIVLVALGFGGPQEIRFPARIGAFGLLVTLQGLWLWANRRDISPYHQAQSHFIDGDYQAARNILESIPESSRVSVDALVLLGNCYRHLGLYDKCGDTLAQALQMKPNHHLALFSRGKLRLVLGDYDRAASSILLALDAGAPQIVRFELGQAYFLQGEFKQAAPQLSAAAAALAGDPAPTLLTSLYLFRIGESERPGAELIHAGIDHWRAEAERYRKFPYGEALRGSVEELDTFLARIKKAEGDSA